MFVRPTGEDRETVLVAIKGAKNVGVCEYDAGLIAFLLGFQIKPRKGKEPKQTFVHISMMVCGGNSLNISALIVIIPISQHPPLRCIHVNGKTVFM